MLGAMGNHLPNTLGANEAARRATNIVKEVYYEEMVYGDWGHLQVASKLESISDPTKPTTLKLPVDIEFGRRMRYEVTDPSVSSRRKFADVTHVEDYDEFIDMLQERNTDDSNVEQVETDEGVPLFIYNDRFPEYWTSIDNDLIIMDAYRKDLSSTLVADKTMFVGKRVPDWQMKENFVPDLPTHKFPQFLAACKERAFETMKQSASKGDAVANFKLRSRQRYKGERTNEQHERRTFGRGR